MVIENLREELIESESDLLKMLDELLEKRDNEWWDRFYADRNKPIPFFIDGPDENLVELVEGKKLKIGRVLDIGCGNGRNSVYLAQQGFEVEGVDISATSINWAKELAQNKGVKISLIHGSFLDLNFDCDSYDFIYDGGCLHHIKPHRRNQYLKKIASVLKQDGYFGLTCFNLKGGANISDYDVYREYSMKGGLGFSEEKLRVVLAKYFKICELREMKEISDRSQFGKEFLWAAFMKKERI